ncbi:MAG: OsmC family peroxiredoxin [Gaiellaceae bacterium]|jgi:osmotically inducible protein OsmC
MAKRYASVSWRGALFGGEGTIDASGSGALPVLPISWASRAESSDGKTSPEELIAAAHASCFAMAFSLLLAEGGTPAEELYVRAAVTFVPSTGITRSELEVSGRVPGIREEAFAAKAEQAKVNCPVSQALRGLETTLSAKLLTTAAAA